jgi:UDP-2,3-diacylglucosamine pyrophosphatase LpxH
LTPIVIIADAHIDELVGNDREFFHMLKALEKNKYDMVFLGDIFDLWIALPRYEKPIHKNFLTWCRQQKERRTVGFIEGNHEYFIADERRSFFSWCSDTSRYLDNKGNLFCHGDTINPNDKNYLRFRKIAKNRMTKTIVRFLPWGPRVGELLKVHLKKTNLEFRKRLPEEELRRYAEKYFKKQVKNVFVGHFHREYGYQNSEAKGIYVLPWWFETGKLMIYDPENGQIHTCHWRHLAML